MRALAAAALAAPVLATPFAASAEEAGDPIVLPEIVVGGGLTPVDAQSFARAVTIIDEAELERRNVRTFSDALRQVPGVSVSRSGGPGGNTDIRIRGSESNHVLVLIDGVPPANASAGVDFSDISPDLIERIEVLRGPQSALYGAGATAGVINIITKGGLRGETRITARAEATTAPGGLGEVLVQGGTDKADIGFGLSYREDDGWDPSGEDGEKDGLTNFTANARGSADLADDLSVFGSFRFTSRRGEFDDTNFGCGSSTCYVSDADGRRTDGTDLAVRFGADFEMLDGALVHTPTVSYALEDNDTIAAFGPSSNTSSSFDARYQAAYTFGPADAHTIVGAIQFKQEQFQSSFAGNDDKSRNQIGYVLDYRGNITDALFVQGGLRFDDNDEFDDFVSWSASASYNFFSTGTRVRGSIGQAQTNPTFFEQFGFIPGQFTGNPNLKPESNFGFDVGVDQSFWDDRGLISVTYFNETLTDEIAGFGQTVDNLDGDSDRQGVEVGLTLAPVDGLTVGAAYTYLDATEPDGSREVRRPMHSASANVVYRFLDDRASVGADIIYNGENDQRNFGDPSFTSPKVTVDDYIVVDINAAYRVTETVELYGGVRNLFNAEYEDVLGFQEQPITGFLGVRATF